VSNDRRRYWEQRLASLDLRAGWYDDLESLGLFSSTHAYDGAAKVDALQSAYLMGRRDVAVAQLQEATREAQQLVALAFTENIAPPKKGADKEKSEDG
jgi:hypothetical protein